ncbi:MAG: hypothetical protein EPO32_04670 [Anaerolineae bacterium]|nr:MAG: hypothetical protein EPO32_04670 [Anaerolineae bacterium]
MLTTRTVDIDRLKRKEDVRGLLKALSPKHDLETRRQAAGGLRWLGLGEHKVETTLRNLQDDPQTPEALRGVVHTSLAVHDFVARALAGKAANCTLPINEIHRMYHALALPLRKRFNGSSRMAIDYIDDHLSAACLTCGHRYTGTRLTDIGSMQEKGAKVVFTGHGNGNRMMMGMCEVDNCFGMELCLNWN